MMKKTGTWDRYAKRLQNLSEKSGDEVKKVLAKEAVRLASDIKRNIRSSGRFAGAPFAPIAPSTIARKGSSKPLIDTGSMMNAVKAEKVNDYTYMVGIPGSASNKGETIAEYAKLHEYGGIGEGGNLIVARPFIRPTVEKTKKDRLEGFRKALKKLFD